MTTDRTRGASVDLLAEEEMDPVTSRRAFARYLAASPLLAALGTAACSDAVGIGRPYLWGLGAFGQPGVERVLSLLRAELRTVMALSGTRTIADVGAASVIRNA